MTQRLPEFPFAAVVGLDPLKTALLLNAINPGIGGVLISGPRGSAKSTLARGLADVLPESGDSERPPFINMPLGTSEDRLTGSLDLKQVLADQNVVFQPGLLAQAHGGVLYVDEVNLLPDTLVDLLLDASARGINVVERDGISHSHASRFMLIGTMNPDEGELRPQLLDRFGLCVTLDNALPVDERIAIVRQREAFDRNSRDFCAEYASQQDTLTGRIRAAQALLPTIESPDWVYRHIADRCEAAQVEGVRADVTWHRAAQAHAAWRGIETIAIEDVDAVEEWVLAHRRTASEPSSGGPTPPPPEQPRPGHQPTSDSGAGRSDVPAAQGQWGAMPPETRQLVETPAPALPDVDRKVEPASPAFHDANATPAGSLKGTQAPGKWLSKRATQKPDWFATLVANRGRWPLRQWRFQRARRGRAVVHLILLDTSGSTLGGQLLARAKGVVCDLARRAYSAREQLAVLGFGNNQIDEILTRRRAPKEMPARFDGLGGGGGTPIRNVLLQASRCIRLWQRRTPGLCVRTYLITDGRTRQSVADLGPFGDCVVIDTEQTAVKRGRAQALARQLGADYRPLLAGESS